MCEVISSQWIESEEIAEDSQPGKGSYGKRDKSAPKKAKLKNAPQLLGQQ